MATTSSVPQELTPDQLQQCRMILTERDAEIAKLKYDYDYQQQNLFYTARLQMTQAGVTLTDQEIADQLQRDTLRRLDEAIALRDKEGYTDARNEQGGAS